MWRFVAILTLGFAATACQPIPPIHVPDPAPDHNVTCEEHPEPYEGDLPCGFIDGEPV